METQHGDPASLLNHYRSLIHLRLSEPALRLGSLVEVDYGDNPRIIAYGREWQGEKVLVIHNISRLEQQAVLDGELWRPRDILFASGDYHVESSSGSCLVTLAPHATLIWK